MIEKWLSIKEAGTPRVQYEVSNLGNVRSVYSNGSTRLRTAEIDFNGYRRFFLSREGKRNKTFRAARLVAQYFVEGYSDELVVDHIDKCILNDTSSNLRWVTGSLNSIKSPEIAWLETTSTGVIYHKSTRSASLSLGYKARNQPAVEADSNFVRYIPTMEPQFSITKKFMFDFGHRVWPQVLDSDRSCNSPCKCKHIHSHMGEVEIEIEAYLLNLEGMVIDFTELKFFKKWIDDTLDHKFIIDLSDPHFNRITGREFKDVKDEGRYWSFIGGNEIDESFVIVDFIPTSENFSKFLYEVLSDQLDVPSIKVSRVTFKEGPNSSATYRGAK